MKKLLLKRAFGILLTLSLIITCIPAAISPSAETAAIPGAHIENGGFEEGNFSNWIVKDSDCFSITADKKLYSNYSVKATGENGHITQSVKIEKDTDYTVGYYSYVDTTGGKSDNGSVFIRSSDETEITNIPIDTAASGKWRYNIKSFNSGDLTEILIDIYLEKGTVYFDEFYIKKANNLVHYGDFPNKSGAGWRGLNNTTVAADDDAFGGSGGSLLKKAEDGITYNTITVEKNTNYILTFYSKGCLNGNYGYIQPVLSSPDSKLSVLSAAGGADWKKSVCLINSGDFVTLKLFIQAKSVYFDNVSVVKAIAVSDIYSAEEGGTVTIADSTSDYAEVGSYNTVTAAADSEHRFAGWYNGNILVSKDAAYTFKVTEGVKLTAKFTVINKADIVNSDFEEDTELKDCGYSNIKNITKVEITDTAAHSGSRSLLLKNDDTNSPNLFLKVNVTKNQDYVLRFFAKTVSEGVPGVQIKGTDMWGNKIILNSFGLTAKTEDWTEYTKTFNSGDHSVIYINFFGNKKEFETYIDDITVAKAVEIKFDAVNGSVNYVNQYGTGSSCLYGDKITATAYPNDMYRLLGWKKADEENYFSTEGSVTLTACENMNIAAVFGFDGYGDLNGDGKLDEEDTALLKKVLLEIKGIEYNAENADVNRNSKIDITDLAALNERILILNAEQ